MLGDDVPTFGGVGLDVEQLGRPPLLTMTSLSLPRMAANWLVPSLSPLPEQGSRGDVPLALPGGQDVQAVDLPGGVGGRADGGPGGSGRGRS